MKRFVFLVALVGVSAASAQTMYKCQLNGKIEYSDKPCVTGNEVKRIAPNGGPTAEDRGRAVMRLQAERERFDAQDRADAQARSNSANTDTRPAPKDAPGEFAAKRDTEKVLTHSKDGWDRKPRAQIEAERQARALGTAAGIAGTGVPTAPGAQSNDPSAGQNEKITVHGKDGWDSKTRGDVVQSKAAAGYAAGRICTDIGNGNCVRADGVVCTIAAGQVAVCP